MNKSTEQDIVFLFDLMDVIGAWNGKIKISLQESENVAILKHNIIHERDLVLSLYEKYKSKTFFSIDNEGLFKNYLYNKKDFLFSQLTKQESSILKAKYGYFNNNPLYIYAFEYYFLGRLLMELKYSNSNDIINQINYKNKNDELMEEVSELATVVIKRVKDKKSETQFRNYLIDIYLNA